MPGIIGFPQLDPGFVGDSRPPEPEEEPATSPESMPTVPDPAVQDYENNLYHRLGLKPPNQTDPPSSSQSTGQASSPDSGGQGKTGSSQTEDARDTGQAAEETSAQAAPPDIDELGDDFGTEYGWIPGVSLDRQSAYSNLDVIRVKQDIETRPLTYELCFRQSPSLQSACEFIYADPEDVGGVEVIGYAWRLFQSQGGASGGSSSDSRNDAEETFTLDDVKQFTEIDLATEKFDVADVAHYEKMLNKVFDYEIVFKESYGYSPEKKISQLQNLAKANVHIVDYLDDVFVNDPDKSGLSVFQESFSQTEQGKLRVHLGDDHKLKDETYGFVPFWGSNTDKVYLGSAVNIATIVHEFGHVLDRNVDMVTYLQTADAPGEEARLMEGAGPYRVGLGELILRLVIEGFAAKQRDDKEVWADLFMTAVLHGQGETVYSLVETSLDGVWTTGNEVSCGEEGVECDWREVGWRLSDHGDLTNNAKAVRGKLLELLPQKL